jgi:hypothetical protein
VNLILIMRHGVLVKVEPMIKMDKIIATKSQRHKESLEISTLYSNNSLLRVFVTLWRVLVPVLCHRLRRS